MVHEQLQLVDGFGGHQRPPRRPALLVIDMTVAFTRPDSPLACDSAAAIENIASLLTGFRESGLPIFFTRIVYDTRTSKVAAPFLEKVPALASCRDGDPAVEIDDRIEPWPSESVIDKLFPSAFWLTTLDALLRSEHCDGTVITGASTSGCVRATAVDSMQYGYRPTVVRDAVADRVTVSAQSALDDVEAKYGSVCDTATILEGLLTEPAGAYR